MTMASAAAAFQAVVDQCNGCDRMVDGDQGSVCNTYTSPSHKWSVGSCNLASHVKVKVQKKAAVNPLKASKKASGG
jgi:hypothetical protein